MKKVSEQTKTKAYEIGVMKLLKEVAEFGDDVHENHTPLEICDMMLDKVDLVSAKSILVLYNVELLFALRKLRYNGQVTFFTQSIKKADLAPKIFQGVTVEYIDKEENPLYLMENKWPDKFDIVIANPPYSNSLDLKFLDKGFHIAKKEIVFVHPSTSFIDCKGKKNLYNEINQKILPELESVELFNGNGIFGINLKVPCSITKINKKQQKTGFKVFNRISNEKSNQNDFSSIHLHGTSKAINSFSQKIQNHLQIFGSLNSKGNVLGSQQEQNRILKNPESFFVEASHIQGNNYSDGDMNSRLHKNDFFVVLNKPRLNVRRGRNPEFNIWWEFSSESEAENFIKYAKTDFARFSLSLLKTNQNLARGEMALIPWMDFTQEWTDEKLYAHFDITKEEQAFIKEVIPPYYD